MQFQQRILINQFFVFFSCESDSTTTNIRPFVRPSVRLSGIKTQKQLKINHSTLPLPSPPLTIPSTTLHTTSDTQHQNTIKHNIRHNITHNIRHIITHNIRHNITRNIIHIIWLTDWLTDDWWLMTDWWPLLFLQLFRLFVLFITL